MTGRQVSLSSLTDREKENALLVLQGYAKDLRALVDELAVGNAYVTRRLDAVLEKHGRQLAFLGRAYERTFATGPTPREISRNDRVWEGLR